MTSGSIVRQDYPLNSIGGSPLDNAPIRKLMYSSTDLSHAQVFESPMVDPFSGKQHTFDLNYDEQLQGRNKAKRIVSAVNPNIKSSPYSNNNSNFDSVVILF